MKTQLKNQHIKSKQVGFVVMPVAFLLVGLGVTGAMISTHEKERVNYDGIAIKAAPLQPTTAISSKNLTIDMQSESFFDE